MTRANLSDYEAEAVIDRIAAQIEQRRRELPDQRQASRPPFFDRRTICAYCFQRGDHPTGAHCLSALEQLNRFIDADES
jgi:hypothetical protein